jgi:hypothetical protein
MPERAQGKERLMPLDASGLLPQLRAVRFLPFRRRLWTAEANAVAASHGLTTVVDGVFPNGARLGRGFQYAQLPAT